MKNIRLSDNVVILDSKSITSTIKNKSGIEMPTDFSFGKVLASYDIDKFPLGSFVCVKSSLLRPIPYLGHIEWEFSSHHALYTYDSEDESQPTDKLI